MRILRRPVGRSRGAGLFNRAGARGEAEHRAAAAEADGDQRHGQQQLGDPEAKREMGGQAMEAASTSGSTTAATASTNRKRQRANAIRYCTAR